MEEYVICLNNEGYAASLEVRKLYELLSDKKAEAMHCIRVVDEDEDGEGYVYPKKLFHVDGSIRIGIPRAA